MIILNKPKKMLKITFKYMSKVTTRYMYYYKQGF